MVQVLPANPRRSEGRDIGSALGQALVGSLQMYSEHQKRQKEDQQLAQESEKYKQITGRDLSKNPKIRELEIEYALKSEGKAKDTAAKLAGEEKAKKELLTFADKLEMNNPNSPVHKTIADIYRTELPMDQKSEIVKSLTGVDPFKVQQQQRLQLDSVLKRYNTRLKELDDEIKNVRNPNSTGSEEISALRRQRMSLRNERDQLLDFRSLNGMEDMEEEIEDFEEPAIEEEEELEEEEGPKVAFDPNNKGHRAAAEKLYKQYKDKEKVRKILSKKFKGL